MPYEATLKLEHEQYGSLPLAGGLLDQPHILLTCFRVIDEERVKWDSEQEGLKKINDKLRDAHAKHHA